MLPSILPSSTRLSPAFTAISLLLAPRRTTHIVAVVPLAWSESRNSWSILKNLSHLKRHSTSIYILYNIIIYISNNIYICMVIYMYIRSIYMS